MKPGSSNILINNNNNANDDKPVRDPGSFALDRMPIDLILEFFSYLDLESMSSLSQTAKHFNKIFKIDRLWKDWLKRQDYFSPDIQGFIDQMKPGQGIELAKCLSLYRHFGVVREIFALESPSFSVYENIKKIYFQSKQIKRLKSFIVRSRFIDFVNNCNPVENNNFFVLHENYISYCIEEELFLSVEKTKTLKVNEFLNSCKKRIEKALKDQSGEEEPGIEDVVSILLGVKYLEEILNKSSMSLSDRMEIEYEIDRGMTNTLPSEEEIIISEKDFENARPLIREKLLHNFNENVKYLDIFAKFLISDFISSQLKEQTYYLNLEDRILYIPEYIDESPFCKPEYRIEELNLNHNGLWVIPNSIFEMFSLRILSIADNNLRSLPAAIGRAVNLTNLNASNNLLRRMPPELFTLTNLKILDLGNHSWSLNEENKNRFGVIPREMENLINLEKIDFENVGLKEVPVLIMYRIKTVNFKNNPDLVEKDEEELEEVDVEGLYEEGESSSEYEGEKAKIGELEETELEHKNKKRKLA